MDSGCIISLGEFYLKPRINEQEGWPALRVVVQIVISCEDYYGDFMSYAFQGLEK